ncbi:hypothetical protein ACFQ4Z_12120 [Oceanobacillus oncorhynchi subsp. oncorhynchi]|uniref:hypothetical protein n=1 Tax=Oceanobacillus oncorhynchi TaxID=545501 RepID=UPI003630CD5D
MSNRNVLKDEGYLLEPSPEEKKLIYGILRRMRTNKNVILVEENGKSNELNLRKGLE